uniref:NADH-ubiquinone oxidoreductase chain 2 n=1 Tax=Aiolocaria hexaspilota TaxID=419962 RepID=A0A4P8GBL9_9CUCU|nr:NADH dehydrogenase subunit 2 [Aiolocaria hexaspilota]QCO91577.1 NADH dehydrogenase subunit 2 [Aiolocaria hexaspilota]
MKLMKIMFYMIMMLGTMISISAYSWINIWIGLEINLLTFIPLINLDKFKQSSETSMKYFMVQVSASMFILFSFLHSFFNSNNLEMFDITSNLLFNCAILLKMGAAPFHIWYSEVMEGLSWMNCILMLTWQKIAPMILMMYNFKMNLFFMMIIVISMTISGLKMWNQTSMKKILALSSINHMGWMMGTMFLNQSLWMLYFSIYSFISINLILVLKKYNINLIFDLFKLLNNNKQIKFFFFLNILSLGGIPPFLGFLPKWMILKILIEKEFYLLSFIMIFMTLLSLYIYMRLILQSLIFKISEKKYYMSLSSYFIYMMNYINIFGLIIFSSFMSLY